MAFAVRFGVRYVGLATAPSTRGAPLRMETTQQPTTSTRFIGAILVFQQVLLAIVGTPHIFLWAAVGFRLGRRRRGIAKARWH